MRKAFAVLFLLFIAVTAFAGPNGDPGRDPVPPRPDPVHFNDVIKTTNTNALWIESVTFGDDTLTTGDEIGVITPGNVCAGALVWTGNNDVWGVGLTVYGAILDTTDAIDTVGFLNGEAYTFKFWDKSENKVYVGVPQFNWGGKSVFTPWGFSQLSLSFNDKPGQNPFEFTQTIDSHIILVKGVHIDGADLADDGSTIGVFTPKGLCVGAAEWHNADLGITAWADDALTDVVDGFEKNQLIEFRIWVKATDKTMIATATITNGGPDKFTIDGITICTLSSVSPEVAHSLVVNIKAGWSVMSMNFTPTNNDVVEMFAPIVDHDRSDLLLVKNHAGKFYSPAWWYNNIKEWNSPEGYQIKAKKNLQLVVPGEPIDAQTPIPMAAGWQYVAYYPDYDLPAVAGFASVVGKLIAVKNDHGGFYLPLEGGFNSMDALKPGEGYEVKLTGAADLVYPLHGRMVQSADKNTTPTHYTLPVPTGADMSLLLTTELPSGYEIAALNATGQIVGAGVVNADGKAGLALWGVDKLSAEPTVGLADNETPRFVVWTGEAEIPADVSASKGDIVYQTDALAIGSLVESPIVTEFGLSAVYPNPFNNVTNISFNLVTENNVTLTVVDLNGRTVATLMSNSKPAGRYSLSFNAGDLASGTYLVRLEAGSQKSVRKLQLLK